MIPHNSKDRWQLRASGRFNRRRLILSGAKFTGGLGALGLAGCSSSKKITNTGASAPGAVAAVDPTKGKPGGTIRIQAFGYAGGLLLVKTNNPAIAQLAGFTHSGLLELRNGTPVVPGDDVVSVGPDLAQNMPEQPDDVTYRFKLKNAKFHNGRPVTSEDVKLFIRALRVLGKLCLSPGLGLAGQG